MKVWRVAFVLAVKVYGEEQRAADEVGITDRRVRQLKNADPRFKAQVQAALAAYEKRIEDEQIRCLDQLGRRHRRTA